MSIYRMSTAQVMKFVELYRQKECLWDVDAYDYMNRRERDRAMEEIAIEMRIDGFGRREVAQKVKNIRSAYHQELKRIYKSKKSGASGEDLYKPRVPWFPIMHSFLKMNAENKETKRKSHLKIESAATLEEQDESYSSDIVETSEDSPTVKVKEERDEIDSYQATISQRKCLQERPSPTSYAIETNEKLNSNRSVLPTETEFDVWCRSLAMQLNNMEPWRALDLQMKIQTLVSKERIEYEKNKLFFPSGSVCHSRKRSWHHSVEPHQHEACEQLSELQSTQRKRSVPDETISPVGSPPAYC